MAELLLQLEKEQKHKKHVLSGIPEHYLQNKSLSAAISILPVHYNFEIYKTLHRIETLSIELKSSKMRVSLQFPEGLMMFGCMISDILREFSVVEVETVIMGDVTYGACCVDDLASHQMHCDLLVHYGHSCLIPITQTKNKILYVFVEIQIDIQHLCDTIAFNFADMINQDLYLMSTIQFNNSLYLAKQILQLRSFANLIIPQEKPRSGGEVLGCTSPRLPNNQDEAKNIIIFVCDGRFHMEAAMIANPKFHFYQYDPYSRNLTEEKYANNVMIERREEELMRARNGKTKRMCFIFGALGRQGNSGILERLIAKVEGVFEHMVLIASEIDTQLLTLMDVDFFVQIACPRLSIDWSYGTPKPLLTPYELFALLENYNFHQGYSMDYYSQNGGPWSNFYGKTVPKKTKVERKEEPKVKLKMEE